MYQCAPGENNIPKYILQIQGDTYLAIHLSCRRTQDGQKITAGMLQNPTALQQLVQTEQAYKF